MVKLVVQIPCHNEAETLPEVLAAIPRQIEGVDLIETLVIDDGSSDGTAEVARAHGADHVVASRKNRGLARSFRLGLDTALQLDADIIVNTDGDNQYVGADIAALVRPILEGHADVVVGDRQTASIESFSVLKRLLQRWGSSVVARFSEVEIPDAVSGFRAYSREAALDTNVVSSFSYTIETLIQAGRKHHKVVSVPVRVNPVTRPSRLFRNIPHFMTRSVGTLLRIYNMYQPLKVYLYLGGLLILVGTAPIVRFLVYYLMGEGAGKLQSLLLGSVLVILGAVALMFGLLADLMNFNRQLAEMTLERLRRLESDLGKRRDQP